MSTDRIKGKIVYSLSLLMVIFIILTFVSYNQLEKTEEIRKIDENLENLLLQNLILFKTDVDFVDVELNNKSFFESGESAYLTKHDSIVHAIQLLIKSIEEEEQFGIDPALWHIDSVLIEYNQIFKALVNKYKQRGYKDFGLEGQLKEKAHELSDKKILREIDLLTLRKYEKNYLMYDDQEYADKFLNTIDTHLQNLKTKGENEQLLKEYKNIFTETVQVSNEIGRYTQEGMKSRLKLKTGELIKALENLGREAEKQTVAAYNFGMNVFLVCAIIAVVSCFFLILFIAKNLR
jgi:hypothetical protein